ncbi:hypothetical protein R84981_002816 [Carnimonas sp. R-84981]
MITFLIRLGLFSIPMRQANNMKRLLALSALIIPLSGLCETTPVEKCGPFEIESVSGDGFLHIDGIRPWTQKVNGSKTDLRYSTIQWMVPYPQVGWLGMNFYIGADHRRWLDVQYVQDNKDAPKLYGQYPCRPIKG